ncbi:ATP-binding protein [Aquabacterium sp.]|uniref:sensor histidine kinase n=1 Tax=Aquabacterium sp. TaxID=1872578 RepID=UPI0025C0CE3D|nr:ATP-binding protein [Aquabacterium sp.]
MLLERALAEERGLITEVYGTLGQHLLARIAPLPSAAHQPPWLVLCLPQVAEQALKEVDLQAQVKDITLAKDLAPAWAQVLPLDTSLVLRALVNLLNNAVKFSPQGSEVHLRLAPTEGFWVIAVIDQGPGIPPAELKKLLRRYERLETNTPAHVGLGLVFIDTVATRHGGRVQCTANTGSALALNCGCQAADLPRCRLPRD